MNVCKMKFESHDELIAFNSIWLVTLSHPDAPFNAMVKSIRDYAEIKFLKAQLDGKQKPSISLKYHEAIGLLVFVNRATQELHNFPIGDFERNAIRQKLNELDQFCA